jgi:hypothetical protein
MPSDQTMKLRSKMHQANITKRGNVAKSVAKKDDKFQVGPVILGVFLFVVVGSALFQILNVAQNQSEL